MIDEGTLLELKNDLGREALAEIVSLFVEEAKASLKDLSTSTDRTAQLAQLHFLKGTACYVGMLDFSYRCGEFETSLNDPNTTPQDLTSLNTEFSDACAALETLLTSSDFALEDR